METPITINQWAEEMFGPTTTPRMFARANHEMAELIDAVTVKEPNKRAVAEEAADTLICVARGSCVLGHRFALGDISGAASDLAYETMMANAHLAELQFKLTENLDVRRELDILSETLRHIVVLCGFKPQDMVDYVMQRNRRSKWKLTGDGHGSRVKE